LDGDDLFAGPEGEMLVCLEDPRDKPFPSHLVRIAVNGEVVSLIANFNIWTLDSHPALIEESVSRPSLFWAK
jgi:hypothetical protein